MKSQEPKVVGLYTEAQSYAPPAVVYEAPLEVRAGSPLSIPDLTDIIDPN
jgi:hypothetical protein